MKYELTVYELGKLLNEVSNNYDISILLKRKLSGGFITITGNVEVEYTPDNYETLKGNNIIGLKVKNNDGGEVPIKITGIKNTKFNIEIAPTKFKEIHPFGLSIDKIKESKDECKLRVDEDLIFTIKAPFNDIEALIKK